MEQISCKPIRPTSKDWNELSVQLSTSQPLIDIIIPVYGAPDDTLRCLYSVLNAKNQTSFNLIVIEDDGPVPSLRTTLKNLSDKFLFEYYENETNKGFVLTCNFGFQIHPERDVILLNSDTEVFDGWLDILIGCALQNPKAGTITAMSNNATICSYPFFCEDFSFPYEISDSELNKLFCSENQFQCVKTPTGVGFCMYIRRECLKQIGYFNYDLFGKGYGEENDLCIRAEKAGWSNLIATGTFVRHYGSSSFSTPQRLERVKNAIKVINKEHPQYLKDIDCFIKADPIFNFRKKIDMKRLQNYIQSKKVFLMITHSLGGGTDKYTIEITEKLLSEGFAVLWLQPAKNNKFSLTIEGKYPLPNLDLKLSNTQEICHFLNNLLNVQFIHIQHLKGFSNNFIDIFFTTIVEKNIPYYVTLHDYYTICPRITLIDESGIFCGEPDENQCNVCIQTCDDIIGISIQDWRNRYQRILEKAHKIFVPDLDVRWRFMRYFPNLNFTVRPHFDNWKNNNSPISHKVKNWKKRVAIIGAIGAHKGFFILKEVAEICSRNNYNIEFIIIGYTQDDNSLGKLNNVKILGKYNDKDLVNIINQENIDTIWFPVICPETYSYTLSASIVVGLPIVAFDFGAIGRRLTGRKNYIPVPLECMLKPNSIIEYLLIDKEIIETESVENKYPFIINDYYQIELK